MADETPNAVTVDGLKRSLRIIDTGNTTIDTQTNAILTGCLNAAGQYVQNAVGTDVDGFFDGEKVRELYAIAVYALAATYYQNPASISTGQTYDVNPVLNSIVGQLRGEYAVQSGGDDDGATSQSNTTGHSD